MTSRAGGYLTNQDRSTCAQAPDTCISSRGGGRTTNVMYYHQGTEYLPVSTSHVQLTRLTIRQNGSLTVEVTVLDDPATRAPEAP